MKAKTDGTIQTTLDFIRKILVREMSMQEDRVNIFSQRFKIPTDDGLFIVIEHKGSPKMISSKNITIPTADSFTEAQEVNMQETIAVGIFSRTLEALQRKEEVLMAINSLYSQGIQEANGFKIARASAIENLTGLEGAAMLYRFEISLVVFAWYRKTKSGDYYEAFEVDLMTEKETVEIPLT